MGGLVRVDLDQNAENQAIARGERIFRPLSKYLLTRGLYFNIC